MNWRSAILAATLGVAAIAPFSILRAQEKRQVTAGKEYETSGQHRRWFGDGYRDLWTTPFEAPVLDLAREGGGLEPVRQVGGLQTPGLAMTGADGRSYTFRSLEKEPERLLPPEWRQSWPAKMLRDATSGTHPGAAVMLPVLAEAARIPHTQPRLTVMPDDPKLGNFRATFANKLGTLEEFPTAGSGTRTGFEGATAIISSADLWKEWLKGPENRIDTRAMVRARILDLFVDNYDRRRGQWRWMKIPGRPAWVPLPEDPDMAFLRRDGLVNLAMRQHRPQLLVFSDEYPKSLEGPTLLASEVDRWLLSDVDIEVYREVARDLQSAWTDEVIERAVAQLPAEWRAVDNGFIAASLKARRTDLVHYVERFYEDVAKRVDIHLTDQSEIITITTAESKHTTVNASVSGAPAPYFSRTFNPDDTKEIRIYVHGGEDKIERSGPGGPIHVRVIADEGQKTIESPRQKTEVWASDSNVSGKKVSRHDPWVNPAPIENAPWIEPRNYGATTIMMPGMWYTTDVGFVIGGSITRTTYGFRSLPAAKTQTIRGGFAFGTMSGKLEYHGVFTRPASSVGYDFRAFGSGIEQVNYFGLGNETPEQDSSRYRSRQRLFSVEPALRVGSTTRFQLKLGPELRHARADMDEPTLLAEEAPYGSGTFASARFKATVEADTRPVANANPLEILSGTPNGEPPDQPPGIGFRFSGSAYVTPSILDVESTYGGAEAMVATYLGNADVQAALRVGGARVWGTFPYFDAASLGGSTNRGFRSDRFAGQASLYGNAELRAYLTRAKYQSVFPVRFGVIGFFDVGRVWHSGEDSSKWHPSGGGGVLLKPVGTPIVFRVVAAYSTEGTLFYVGSGFRF
jgi:hypothetical protein